MGAEIGITIRLLDEANNTLQEIDASTHHHLGAVLEGSKSMIYISSNETKSVFLRNEEFDKIRISQDPEQEMMMISKITDTKEAFRIFNKINHIIEMKISNQLGPVLMNIDETESNEIRKSSRKIRTIQEYTELKYTVGFIMGILKLASTLHPNIQIVGEYY